MQPETMKKAGTVAAIAALSIAASVVTTKLASPSSTSPTSAPTTAPAEVRASSRLGAKPPGNGSSVMFDGDLEMPIGTTCAVDKTATPRTAQCVMRPGTTAHPRLVDCVVGDDGKWGCGASRDAP